MTSVKGVKVVGATYQFPPKRAPKPGWVHKPIPRDRPAAKVRLRRESDGYWRFYCPYFGHVQAFHHFSDAIKEATECATYHSIDRSQGG